MPRKNNIAFRTELHRATIKSLSHEGRGVATVNGKTTFIRAALPQEEVNFTYTSKRGSFDEGVLAEVLSPSLLRVTPPCAHFGVCGGCSLQHLSQTDQIAHKQQVLSELFNHHAHIQPLQWLAPLRGPSLHYRRSARLSVKHLAKDNQVLVGFREINGRMIARLTRCEILEEKIGYALNDFATLIKTLSIPHKIPQIEISSGDDHTAVIIRHMADFTPEDHEKLHTFAKDKNFYLYLQPKGPETIHCIYPDPTAEFLSYAIDDLIFYFHPLDFIQVNAAINKAMIQQSLQLLNLKKTDRVLDLFCGLGNFSLPLAQRCAHVLGVEGEARMVDRARYNAQVNQLPHAEFQVANLFETQHDFLKKQYDKILLDPPRAGAQEIIPHLKGALILYISCNPMTLARDAALLTQQGYTLTHAGIMDMFTHTSHVESMALFEK